MATKDWNGFKKSGDTYIPNDSVARAGVAEAFPRSEQAVLGAKNVFKTTMTDHIKNDVTFSVDDDGVVELSGTSTGDINVGADNGTVGQISNLKVDQKYILSGCPIGGGSGTYRLVIRNESATSEYYVDTGEGIEFTAKNVTYTVYIRANSGVNLTGKVFKPMISLDGGEFVPYAMTNRELTEQFFYKRTHQSFTLAANSHDTYTIPTYTGYIPVSVEISTSGAGSGMDFSFALQNGTVQGIITTAIIRNIGASERTWDVYFTVLYMKE